MILPTAARRALLLQAHHLKPVQVARMLYHAPAADTGELTALPAGSLQRQ
ncbi:hypothetical protein ABZY19_24085 [Streptomyces sp. NPDC006475]